MGFRFTCSQAFILRNLSPQVRRCWIKLYNTLQEIEKTHRKYVKGLDNTAYFCNPPQYWLILRNKLFLVSMNSVFILLATSVIFFLIATLNRFKGIFKPLQRNGFADMNCSTFGYEHTLFLQLWNRSACILGNWSMRPLSIFFMSRANSQRVSCSCRVVVNADSRWHHRLFVWIEADKEKSDKVMLNRDNFFTPPGDHCPCPFKRINTVFIDSLTEHSYEVPAFFFKV